MTKDESASHDTQSPIFWWLLTIVVVVVYLFKPNIPFLGPDEARYAQVAREMFDRGDLITPTLGGYNWFEKPPLLYWLQIVSYKVFGVSEFAARLGPAICGLGTIVSLWILGKYIERVSNAELQAANNFANWLALIAASTLGIIVYSHGASFDIIITFPVSAALVTFYIFDQSEDVSFRKRYLMLIIFYVFMGIALLAKGLIGMIFPLAIAGLYYLLSLRLPPRVFVISLFWGPLLAIAIASVWYLPMYHRHGYQFIDEFFIQHHFQRFSSNKYLHPQPIYFFLWVLPLMTLPWLPFFLRSIWKFLEGLFRHEDTKTRNYKSRHLAFFFSPLHLFAASWIIFPLVFFSLSGSKLPGYILPSVPGALILSSDYAFELAKRSNKWRNTILLTAVSTFVSVILLMLFAMPRYASSDSVKTLIQAADESGYHSNRVLTLHTISHNAEYYAAGRLLRDAQGKQVRLESVSEVENEIAAQNGRAVLLLIPIEYLSQVTNSEKLNSTVIKDNGELAIAAASLK